MRIGLYGGSFDPIHNGHLSIVRGALDSGAVDLIIVIPSGRNPFKRGKTSSAAPYRYYMTSAVISDEFDRDVYVSDAEFFTEGISYTINTIRYITRKDHMAKFLISGGVSEADANEDHQYFWISGSDILGMFEHWYKVKEIISMVSLLIASRPGDAIDIDQEIKRISGIIAAPVSYMKFDIEGVDVSSSEIRHGKSLDQIPDAALEFIKTHALYLDEDILSDISDAVCEQFYDLSIKMYPILREKRLLHTINTGILSCHYAKIHGADPEKALIAGILHDCAKELPEDEQRRLAYERSGDTFTDEKLLHSPAGATLANEKFGIEDEEILDAITYHTTGRSGMTTLDKIVYLADKVEPSRIYTDLTDMRKVAETDLDEAVRMCMGSVINKFKEKNREIHPLTIGFAEQMGLL